MRQTFWQKRIPTLIVISLIVAGIGVTSFLTNTGVIITGRASISTKPESVRVTNIASDTFTVTYITGEPTSGALLYGSDKNNLSQTTLSSERLVHSITLDNLSPNTKYFFSIVSGQDTYLNGTAPFEATTGLTLPTSPSKFSITGNVQLPDGSTPQETVVYVKTEKSQTLSAISQTNGSFSLSMNGIRTEDGSAFMPIDNKEIIQILITDGHMKSIITTTLNEARELPLITLSNDYDFTTSSPSETFTSPESLFPLLSTQISSVSAAASPDILSPKKDEAFADQQPLFRGTALPGSRVTITINSESPIQEVVTANANGTWTYRPQTSLAPGQHTVTISARDNLGILKTITKTFTVYAQGTQVAQSATPSATVTIIPSPTPTFIPTPTYTPTPSPTSALSPTTLIPSPTPFGKGGVIQELPPTGNSLLVIASVISAAIFISSIVLFKILQKNSSPL